MNEITVLGSTPRKRELALDVAYFCLKELLPRTTTLDIEINIRNIEGDVDGYCLEQDDNRFELEISTGLKDPDFITSIMHEMTHVYQHKKGWLKDINQFLKLWKGEEYIPVFSTVDEYVNLPWETEAYEMQEILYKKYLKLKEIKNAA